MGIAEVGDAGGGASAPAAGGEDEWEEYEEYEDVEEYVEGGPAPVVETNEEVAAIGPAAVSIVAPEPPKPKGLDPVVTREKIKQLALDVIAGGDDDDFTIESPFMESGVDSLGSVQLVTDVGKAFGMGLSPSVVFDFPTVAALAEHIV